MILPQPKKNLKRPIPKAERLMFGDSVPNKYNRYDNSQIYELDRPDKIDNIRQSFLDMTGVYVCNFHAKLVADMHSNLISSGGRNTFAYIVNALPSQRLLELPKWASKPNHAFVWL